MALKEFGHVLKVGNVVIMGQYNKFNFVGFEVFTAVTMKNAVFWDVAPCGYIINRHFEGTFRLLLQLRRYNVSEKKF
jgi:hypothetical protein